MPKTSDPASAFTNLVQSAQSMLAAGPILGLQTTHFWQAQDTVLEEVEKFSSAWFKRRHEGTREALNTSKRLTEKAVLNPAAAMRILSDWQKHSMERLAGDAKDYAAMMTSCADALVNNEVEAIADTVKTAKRAATPVKSEPV